MKENSLTGKKVEKEKNMIYLKINYYMKAIFSMIKDTEKVKHMMNVINILGVD